MENEKTPLSSKTTCPFPVPCEKENWTINPIYTGLWSSGALYCQGGRLQPPAQRKKMTPSQNLALGLRINKLLDNEKREKKKGV